VNGTQYNIPFTQEAYRDIFQEHLEELNRFDEYTKSVKLLPSILQDLYNNGR
jgi:hypothetical protein